MKTTHRNVMRMAAVAAIAAGTALAQGPGFGRWGATTGGQLDRMATILTLDVGQKEQAKTIFDKAYTGSQALQPSLLQARTALRDAVRTGKGNVEQLSAAAGALMAKMQLIHATALAQLYNILTPAQREQFDKYQAAGLCLGPGGGTGMGMGMGMGMGRGMMRGARP